MENLETNYLQYPEAVKEAVKPGYKADWKVEAPVEEVIETPDENESTDDLEGSENLQLETPPSEPGE